MKIYGYVFGVVLLSTIQILQTSAAGSCKNGGSPLVGSHQKCTCVHGYKGYDCSQKVTPCEVNPCRHFGKCIENEHGSFDCKCLENYDGILCERKVLPCDSNPCKNGGKCSNDGEKCFKCDCPDGYKGNQCSEKIKPCEIFPCKNGGICTNENDTFKCACKSSFGGPVCERRDALYSSLILEQKKEYVNQLEQWLNGETDWRLCYRATRDGWRAADFHSRCDHKGETVTIVRSNHYIFGGFSDIPWGGSAGYKRTEKSFLFSLRNKLGKEFKSMPYQNQQNAIYTNPSYGPTFGGGHDFYIRDQANSNTGSYTNFGHTYKPPFGYKYNTNQAKTLFAGSYNFIPSEVEVFYMR